MDITFVKLLILWMTCHVIGLTTGIPLNDNVDSKTRIKRMPAGNFSLFNLNINPPFPAPNPIAKFKESISKIGHKFAPLTFLSQRKTVEENPIQSQSTFKNADKKPLQQHDRNKEDDVSVSDNYSILGNRFQAKENLLKSETIVKNSENIFDKNVMEENKGTSNDSKNLTNIKKKELPHVEGINKEIDKELVDFIFNITPNNNLDSISTTVDPAADYTTETGDFESTTIDELLRIPSQVVASLLG